MMNFAEARRTMVDAQVRTSGVTDRALLASLLTVPREEFVPEARRSLAYTDAPHRLATGTGARHVVPVAPMAQLVQLAEIGADERVLDIGCATGYWSAVLARLTAHVVGVEPDAGLAAIARDNLTRLGIENVEIVSAPFLEGAPDKGPYDVILLEGMLDAPPEPLFAQLKVGGRLVCLIRDRGPGTAYLFTKSGTDVAGTASFNTTLPQLPVGRRQDVFVF